MHIWIINQSFRPETIAPANRFYGLGSQWTKLGLRITMLTGQPYRPHGTLTEGYDGKDRVEEIDDITVIRHQEKITKKKRALPQAISQISFAWRVYKNQRNIMPEDKPDVIIASSPDFFHVIAGWALSVHYKVPFIMEVRDLWPEIFRDMGVLTNNFLLWILERMARFCYWRANAIVTVTQGYAKSLAEKGVLSSKIYVIPNAVADADFIAYDKAREEKAGERLRSELHINPLSKIVVYIGNHGKAQALGQIIDASRLLMNRSDIQFLLVGDGTDKKRLKELAKGLPNVQFLPNQPKEKIGAFYAMSTINLSCLRNIPSFNTTIPSKIFEIMAATKPLVACLQGEAAEIIKQSGGGIVVPPENPQELAKTLEALVDDSERLADMAKKGRKFAESERKYSKLARQYVGILNHVIATNQKNPAKTATKQKKSQKEQDS